MGQPLSAGLAELLAGPLLYKSCTESRDRRGEAAARPTATEIR